MYVGNYTTDNGSVIRILDNVMDNNSNRFVVIGDVVGVAALIIAKSCCILFALRRP
jgi:hypothetical protein